ncbi:hypothetical protein A2397_06175 [Candidatus Amesbacteria bacterium RIFOXYB1_FULL_44_23]|uniref:PD-(D/E)XK endonuclease-like domain-containing protein n=1 Tax=Candidatus Amesbacteria bacterium RIFOXYB1_FULL_44_23 TaxID=1797263 RepID=A0A1F4ZT47_9BACT|nr:MAG: hypothetical protein A2397_06175 [Candidatus Amesbacteria bacterium RIFOXYB1_FULL_44_23]
MYKLSPSDFAYLYEECKHCFVLKIKYGIPRPSSPMPGVFGAINSRLQGSLVGENLRLLSPSLPDGMVESQEGWLESKPVPGTQIYLKGKYDLLVKLNDGSYLVVDFKISQPSEDKAAKYQSQLLTYKYALENPAKGQSKQVSQTGLILMYPDTVKFENGRAILDFPPTWVEIEPDLKPFYEFMIKVSDLLSGPTPPENPDCLWCKYRHLGEKLAHPQTEDIPF